MLPGVFGGYDLSLNAPLTKSAGDQNAIAIGQVFVGGFVGDQLG